MGHICGNIHDLEMLSFNNVGLEGVSKWKEGEVLE
jgi:hypothetical protein